VNRRQEQKSLTRGRILDVARARFIAVGYAATTIRDVASEADVSIGSVHAHFVDKAALLRACLYDDIAKAVSRIWETLDERKPLLDQLVQCAQVLYESYARHPELSRAMLTETFFPKAGEGSEHLLEPFLDGVARLFQRAEERGEIRLRGGDPAPSAEAFFCLYFMVLVGGLAGAYGQARSARKRAEAWAAKLGQLLELQLVGVGLASSSP